MKNVKWTSLLLALVLCLFALGAQAETIEIPTVYASITEDMPSNDELFNEYALRKLYGMEDVSFFGAAARERLPELMKKLYDAVKPEIEKIAAGERSATTFTFTPEQLGAMGFTVSGSFTTNAEFNAIGDAFSKELEDFNLLLPALLRDCPYEMYWCDYTVQSTIGGGSFSGTISGGVGTAQMNSDVTITLPVAYAYSLDGSTTAVDTTKAKAAAAAAAKAQTIVAAAADMDDEAKLEYYAEQIMALVSYDHDAAKNDSFSTNSNPWQLISVFDGDTATNVVCEGYAKAFQYLCDLSTFTEAEVYTVSGTMTGGTGAGPHMWNIVSLGGKNYLVDVTNSDAGTVGADGSLFMAKAASGDVTNGYIFTASGQNISFVYDDDQEALWGKDVLTLALNVPVASITNGSTVTKYMDFADALAAWTNGTTLTLLDDVSYGNDINIGTGVACTLVGGSYKLELSDSSDIYNTGTLTINGGTITSSKPDGGTIYNDMSSALEIINATIINTGNAAVLNYGELTARNSTLNGTIGLDNGIGATAELTSTTLTYIVNRGEATIADCTITEVGYEVDFRGGKLTFTDDCCDGWVVWNDADAAVVGEEIILPDDYYLFDTDGKAITTLEAEEFATIGAHTSHDYDYTINTDGLTHNKTCSVGCGEGENNVTHTFVDGACACGATQVAQVGSAIYADFAKALAAWTDGTTLTLLDDVSYGNDINIGTGVACTLVGGSYKLELSDSSNIHNAGTLTIKGGTITSSVPDGGTIYNDMSGALEIINATIINTENAAVHNCGELTARNSTLNGAIGLDNDIGASAELTSTTLTYIVNRGEATIADCTITEVGYEVDFRDGKLTFTDDCCDGWVVWNESDAVITVGKEIILPYDYYLFDTDGKAITTLEVEEFATITKHTHSYEYTADEETNTITYACTCGLGTQTAKLTAPAGTLVYDGAAHPATVEASTSESAPVVTYTLNDETVTEAINAGTYTATMTWGGKSVSVEYTIEPASLAAAAVTAADETYTGEAITPAPVVTLNGVELAKGTDYTVGYANNTNAGAATVTITGVGNYTGTVTGSFAIGKATPEVTAPTVVAGLAYTGEAQALVTAGTTTGGTLLYSLDGQTWSENEPAGIEAGDYTVYYKVDGGANYESVEAKTLAVTIGKAIAGLTAAPTANNRTYDGTEQPLVTAGTVSAGTLVYSTEENGTYAATIPVATNAGSYTVWYYVQGGNNYDDTEKASVQVEIKPIELEVNANDAAYAKTYDGTTSTKGWIWKQTLGLEGDLLPGAYVQLTLDPPPAYPESAVGSYDAEIGVELMGEDAPNYKLNTDKVTVTAIIDPKPLTASAAEGARAYDATADWTASLTLSGLVGNDAVTATANFQLEGSNVGEYTTATVVGKPELSGADANNYTLDSAAVTFIRATINKAAADKWSYTLATPQDVLVGSGLSAITLPASGTGIGGEAVEPTGVTFYTNETLQTEATDAAISALAEGENVTLFYKATADNYEATTGSVMLVAIDHQHEWTYTADDATDTITAKCSGTIGTCPNETITYTLVIPTGGDFNSGVDKKTATCGISPANASGAAVYGFSYSIVSENAKLKDGNPYNAGDYEVTMNVADAAFVTGTLTIAPVQIGQPDELADGVYTGEAHQPAVTIPNCTEGADFTVTYPTDMVNAGEKTITVTGKGNYKGTVELGYMITRAPIDAAVITAESQVYTGEALEPAFTVALGGKTLAPNADFTYNWTDNVNAGEGKIVIIGIANYEGQAEGTFAITSAPADLTAETYLGETMTGDFTYGDVITIKGAVTVDQPRTFSLRSAPAANEVALYLEGGNEVIAGPVAADPATGEFTLTYDTSNKDIGIEQRNLTLEYVSDGNKNDTTGSLTVTLYKKELTIASAEATDRVYAQGNKLVNVTGVTLEGIIGTDDVGADLTGVQGTLTSDNAGDYTTLALPELSTTGNEKDYYIIAADEAVTTDVTITKLVLVSVEKPTDATLDTYLTTAEQVADKLPATITYTDANGGTVELDAAWTCANYSAAPNANNTFTWTVDAASLTNHELASGVAATGTITVTNTNALPVTLTGTDGEITFAQQPYDVAAMFTIDANAGAAHYEVVSGEAVLDGTSLTVTKVGEIVIRLTTDAHDAYAAAETTAKLTVTKADPDVTAPEGLTATYGQNLANVTLPAHDLGTWAWVDEDTNVGDAGTQTHAITFTPNDTTNWNTLTLEAQVTVSKVGTNLTLAVFNGETETRTFTYGETVTVLAQPMRPTVLSLRSFTAPAADQMALFLGDKQISEAVDADENGLYTMTLDTADKALKVGDNAITLKYVGNANVEGAQGETTVTLQKKPLSIVNMAAKSRAYQPENQQVDVTAVELEGKIEGDDVAIGTLTAQVSSANVGTYAEAKLPETVPLSGADADYYAAVGAVTVPVPQKVSITQATTTATGTGADAGQPAVTPVTEDGKTLADIPLTLPEGAYNVPGTIHWVDGDDTPVEEGKEYAWVFIPADPNYAPVNGTVVIYPAGEAPVITAPAAAQTVTVVEGETGTMTVTATDAEKYQWYINRNDGKGYVAIDGAAAASYTTSAVKPENNGFTYWCEVSNAYGESKSPVFTLKVQEEVDVPQTGDEAQLGLWLALMALSLGGLTWVAVDRKRREN